MASPTGTYFVYRTPHGPVTIRACAGGIANVAFGDVTMEGARRPSELTNRAATELLEYFAGKRRAFDLPLAPDGSAFQREVWNAVAALPYGTAATPTELAHTLERPGSYRAVGAAVKKNPLTVLVPDHRVVGTNGRPPGADAAARLRGALLDLERERLAALDG